MAMSAAAVIVVLVTTMLVTLVTAMFVAFVTTMVFTAATVVTATAATACHVGNHVFNLLIRGLTCLQHGTLEVQRLACQWMIQVNLNLFFAHSQDMSVEMTPFLVLQRDNGPFIDVLVVEMAVNAEHFTVQIEHVLVHVFTVGLFLRNGKLKGVTLVQTDNLLLEGIESYAKAGNKLERLLGRSLFHHLESLVTLHV